MDYIPFDRPKTVKITAEHYNKHEGTIRRWIAEGRLIAEKDPGGRDWWIKGTRKDFNPAEC